MSAVAKIDNHQLTEIVPATSMMEIISRAASDPNTDVEKLERLMAMAERIEARNAKASYIQALVEMKPKLPVIDRKGRIEVREKTATGKRDGDLTQNTPYALWEDIDEAITPILAEHGFVLTHRCGTANDGKILITGVLSHKDGHSEETTMALPHDSSGSKNAVQAVGSSTQYGKRYTAGLLLNLRTRGQDDDGKKGGDPGTITDEQLANLRDLIDQSHSDIEKFCKYMGVGALKEIAFRDHGKALEALNLALDAWQKKQTKGAK